MEKPATKAGILFLIVLSGLVWLVTACKPIHPASLPTEVTPMQTLAESHMQEKTLSPTSAFTPTQMPSSTPSKTATPDWISMAIGNHGLIEELAYTPGCQLPCWWGITPGVTKWEEVEKRLAGINADVYIETQPGGEKRVELYIPVFANELARVLSNRLTIRSNVVQQIDTDEMLGSHAGDLRYFLAENGKPDEIWIHSFENNMGGPPPFDIWLFYWDKGIAAEFFPSEKSAKYRNGQITACIDRGPILYLWNDPIQSVQEVENNFQVDFGMPYHPILPVDKALRMSVEQFYEKYQDINDLPRLACFTSERSLWPVP